jgi:hypothetical protein
VLRLRSICVLSIVSDQLPDTTFFFLFFFTPDTGLLLVGQLLVALSVDESY